MRITDLTNSIYLALHMVPIGTHKHKEHPPTRIYIREPKARKERETRREKEIKRDRERKKPKLLRRLK